jgi:hypothetical protein
MVIAEFETLAFEPVRCPLVARGYFSSGSASAKTSIGIAREFRTGEHVTTDIQIHTSHARCGKRAVGLAEDCRTEDN